jgi:hypothetical protein
MLAGGEREENGREEITLWERENENFDLQSAPLYLESLKTGPCDLFHQSKQVAGYADFQVNHSPKVPSLPPLHEGS